MSMEIRRIQRLGSSSLVVTLPKEWARRLGLKPGSQVMLIDDGNSIRILPMNHEAPRGVYIDLSKVEPTIVHSIPYCIYLSGYDAATVKLPDPDKTIPLVKKKTHEFMGMEVFEASDNEVKFEILIDMNKIEFNRLFKTMSLTMSRGVKALKEVIENHTGNIEELRFLHDDFLRTLYLALRYLTSSSIGSTKQGTSSSSNLYIAMASNYVSLIVELLYDFIKISNKLDMTKLAKEEKEKILEILDKIETVSSLELRLIANPSAKRTAELFQLLEQITINIEKEFEKIKTPIAGLILGKLQDVVRLLKISSYGLICKIIFE